MADTTPLSIHIDEESSVSGLLRLPDEARAVYVLAHGAGAGMNHPFMAAMADALAGHAVGTLRYQFPYMERGSRRPDTPRIVHAAIRAAVAEAGERAPDMPLFAGGKSFGGRMTSQAQAAEPLSGVRGLVFLGFPLHPPGKPGNERGDHLFDVDIPMLFLQGTRDEFARLDLLQPLIGELGGRADIDLVQDANHSYRVPKATGLSPADVIADLAARVAAWIDRNLGAERQ